MNSAPGPDKIPPSFLKNTKHVVSSYLSKLMNDSFQTSEIPSQLIESIIAPIFKGGDRTTAKNYRPVALTSHITKIMERIIKDVIVQHLEDNCVINENQHGFQTGRSTISELLKHYDNIIDAMDSGGDLDVIMLDFSKAFDKVHYSLLLNKLKDVGISGNLGVWIGKFLLDRKQQVKVNGSLSELISVLSGVPQGSILGPLLFIIFINDIYDRSKHSKISSYADDTKMSKKVRSEADKQLLQQDLDNIYDWTNENMMKFNSDKLEYISFTSSVPDSDYVSPYCTSEGSLIKPVNSTKDLGIVFDRCLTFETHIFVKVAKAKKLCGYIFRTFITRNPEVLMNAYKSLVIPVLEYGCIIWNPSKLYLIRRLEQVQRNFTSRLDMDCSCYLTRL